jgi:hypothetical protein
VGISATKCIEAGLSQGQAESKHCFWLANATTSSSLEDLDGWDSSSLLDRREKKEEYSRRDSPRCSMQCALCGVYAGLEGCLNILVSL